MDSSYVFERLKQCCERFSSYLICYKLFVNLLHLINTTDPLGSDMITLKLVYYIRTMIIHSESFLQH